MKEEGKRFSQVKPNQNIQKDMDFHIKQRLQGTQSILNGSLSSVLQVHLQEDRSKQGRRKQREQDKTHAPLTGFWLSQLQTIRKITPSISVTTQNSTPAELQLKLLQYPRGKCKIQVKFKVLLFLAVLPIEIAICFLSR